MLSTQNRHKYLALECLDRCAIADECKRKLSELGTAGISAPVPLSQRPSIIVQISFTRTPYTPLIVVTGLCLSIEAAAAAALYSIRSWLLVNESKQTHFHLTK